jgi:hypothetical protein
MGRRRCRIWVGADKLLDNKEVLLMPILKQMFSNKFGIVFALIALAITAGGYAILFWRGTVGQFTFPLIYAGFGLPFFFSIFARGIAGCGLKDPGCTYAGYLGFAIGIFSILLFYYFLGCFVSYVIRKVTAR